MSRSLRVSALNSLYSFLLKDAWGYSTSILISCYWACYSCAFLLVLNANNSTKSFKLVHLQVWRSKGWLRIAVWECLVIVRRPRLVFLNKSWSIYLWLKLIITKQVKKRVNWHQSSCLPLRRVVGRFLSFETIFCRIFRAHDSGSPASCPLKIEGSSLPKTRWPDTFN